jgi:hypothetical protein
LGDCLELGADDVELTLVITHILVDGKDAAALLDHEGLEVGHTKGVAVGEDRTVEADLEDVEAGELGGVELGRGLAVEEASEAASLALELGADGIAAGAALAIGGRYPVGGRAVRRHLVLVGGALEVADELAALCFREVLDLAEDVEESLVHRSEGDAIHGGVEVVDDLAGGSGHNRVGC